MKIPVFWRSRPQPGAAPAIPQGYGRWLIALVVALVGSLVLLAIAAAIAFIYFADAPTPIWLIALGVVAALGVATGFGGLVLLIVIAGWRSFRA